LQSINNSSVEAERLRDDVLQTTFDRSWTDLNAEIEKIDFKSRDKPTPHIPESNKTGEILEELLSLGRAQMNMLRSPEELFPHSIFQIDTTRYE